jgi:hypothetical protein
MVLPDEGVAQEAVAVVEQELLPVVPENQRTI